jgi:hypothetical protein
VTLTPCPDLSAADWITTSAWPWDRLVTFGPEGFEAYARLRVIPDPERPGQHEGDVEPIGLSEVAQLRIAVGLLAAHTRTADAAYVAWWDGWPGTLAGFDRADLEASRFDVPHRSFFLFQGSLAGFDAWATRADSASEYCPAFVWPADRAWCVTFDVDPHWAGIGAAAAAIEDLRTDPRLDVVLADPEDRPPAYY